LDTAEDEGVDVGSGFAPHSPWSQPPVHRPAVKPDPAQAAPPPVPIYEPPFEPTYQPGPEPTYHPEPASSYPPGPEPTYFPKPASGYQPPADPVESAPAPAPSLAYEPITEGETQRFPMAAPPPTMGRPPPELGRPRAELGRPHAALGLPPAALGRPPRQGAGVRRPGEHAYPEVDLPLTYPVPTAEEFATRRAVRPREWVATTGVRAAAQRGTFGLVRLRPNRREREGRVNLAAVRRAFGGLRQVTVVNPKGGAGKTVATLMLGLTYGQTRGGFVLAWDNNETQGTLGMRAQPDLHGRTVRDLLRDLDRFGDGAGRIGELAAYVRSQEDAMFDVLASDEGATAGEMLTARAFRDIRTVVGRFYKMILVDTGNNVRAENWQAAVDATDQLVITMSARNDSAETAARLLDHLEQTGRRELVRRAITVVTMPPHRKEVDPRAIVRHFDQRCRAVLRVPYDRHLDSGGPVRYSALSPESRRAWLRAAAAIADGL
jgi:MinD-like ATPase involved in chromosome partitioning or flagellar assembly